MGVAGFFLVRRGARLVSLGSFAFLCFIQECPCGRLFRSGSSGFFRCATWVAVFVQVRLGSFGFVWFARVRPDGRWVRLHSSGLFGCAVRVAGFVQVRLARPGAPM